MGLRLAQDTMATPPTHRVRSGESLTAVARRHGLSVAALAKANGLSSKAHLQIGQVLRLPTDQMGLSAKAQAAAKAKAEGKSLPTPTPRPSLATPTPRPLVTPVAKATPVATPTPVAKPTPVDPEAPTVASMVAMIAKLEKAGISKAWLAQHCAENQVPVELALAIICKESKGNPKAKSGAGAKGLMQLMPRTARSFGIQDAYDPRQNLRGGLRYMGENLERFKQNLNLSLAAYNAGPTKVAKLGRVPNYKETQEYVARIPEWMPIAKAAWQQAGAR